MPGRNGRRFLFPPPIHLMGHAPLPVCLPTLERHHPLAPHFSQTQPSLLGLEGAQGGAGGQPGGRRPHSSRGTTRGHSGRRLTSPLLGQHANLLGQVGRCDELLTDSVPVPSPPTPQVRFLHDPSKAHGFVGAALSSNVIHFTKVGRRADACLDLDPDKKYRYLDMDIPRRVLDPTFRPPTLCSHVPS